MIVNSLAGGIDGVNNALDRMGRTLRDAVTPKTRDPEADRERLRTLFGVPPKDLLTGH